MMKNIRQKANLLRKNSEAVMSRYTASRANGGIGMLNRLIRVFNRLPDGTIFVPSKPLKQQSESGTFNNEVLRFLLMSCFAYYEYQGVTS